MAGLKVKIRKRIKLFLKVKEKEMMEQNVQNNNYNNKLI